MIVSSTSCPSVTTADTIRLARTKTMEARGGKGVITPPWPVGKKVIYMYVIKVVVSHL